jgi:hypothetical protein
MGVGMPETRHARSGDVSIAYQVVGEGPFDMVVAPVNVSHVEVQWEVPEEWSRVVDGVSRLITRRPWCRPRLAAR